jgi:hypothetical protein
LLPKLSVYKYCCFLFGLSWIVVFVFSIISYVTLP